MTKLAMDISIRVPSLGSESCHNLSAYLALFIDKCSLCSMSYNVAYATSMSSFSRGVVQVHKVQSLK